MTTADEKAVLASLVAAWQQYVALPVEHPDEIRDFTDAIHRAQDLLAIRVARRADPDTWVKR
jgi:hypothetical protein